MARNFDANRVARADRYWYAGVAAFTAAFFWTAIRRATIKPFWHDEIYTLILANLGSLRTIWTAQQAGLDTMPPLNAMLTHGVFAVIGVGPISARLPGMLGIWTATLVLFAIVRQRANTIAGLCAMLMLVCSSAGGAAYDARGYGVMLGLFALALWAWSEAASGHRRAHHLALLAVALAGGMWTHYYAALAAVPIVTGEVVRLVRSRKPDWSVVGSLAVAGIASLPLYPGIKLAASESVTYFQHTGLSDLPHSYSEIAGVLISPWAMAFGVLILATTMVPPVIEKQERRESTRIPAHEVAAGVTTLLIPVVAIVFVGPFVSWAFVPRYAMCGVVGFCLVVPILASWLRRNLAPPFLCLVLVAVFLYTFRDVRPSRADFVHPMAYRPLLVSTLSKSTPIVITGRLYLEIWQYLPPESRQCLTYVADPSNALRLIGTDSLERDYLVLRDWAPVRIQEYDAFVREHAHFYLYSVPALTWLPAKLWEEHASVRELGREFGATMYEVTMR